MAEVKVLFMSIETNWGAQKYTMSKSTKDFNKMHKNYKKSKTVQIKSQWNKKSKKAFE